MFLIIIALSYYLTLIMIDTYAKVF